MKIKCTDAHNPVLEAWKSKLGEREGLVSSDSHGIGGTSGIWWEGSSEKDALLPSYQVYRSAGVGCIGWRRMYRRRSDSASER